MRDVWTPANTRFDFDLGLCGGGTVAGADEAGRGSLAGPLVAAAVCLRLRRLGATTTSRPSRPSTTPRSSAGRRAPSSIARSCAGPATSTVVCCSPRTIDERGLHRCNLAALAAARSRRSRRSANSPWSTASSSRRRAAAPSRDRRRRPLRGHRRRLHRRQGDARPAHGRLHERFPSTVRPPRRLRARRAPTGDRRARGLRAAPALVRMHRLRAARAEPTPSGATPAADVRTSTLTVATSSHEVDRLPSRRVTQPRYGGGHERPPDTWAPRRTGSPPVSCSRAGYRILAAT